MSFPSPLSPTATLVGADPLQTALNSRFPEVHFVSCGFLYVQGAENGLYAEGKAPSRHAAILTQMKLDGLRGFMNPSGVSLMIVQVPALYIPATRPPKARDGKPVHLYLAAMTQGAAPPIDNTVASARFFSRIDLECLADGSYMSKSTLAPVVVRHGNVYLATSLVFILGKTDRVLVSHRLRIITPHEQQKMQEATPKINYSAAPLPHPEMLARHWEELDILQRFTLYENSHAQEFDMTPAQIMKLFEGAVNAAVDWIPAASNPNLQTNK